MGGRVKLAAFAAGFVLAIPVVGRAVDQQFPGQVAIGAPLMVEDATYQGKGVHWWARRAVQARKDANARARTIRQLRSVVRARLDMPTGHWLDGAFLCIHRWERNPRQGWQTSTGNGYAGGLQMDDDFVHTYAPAWVIEKFGADASKWPASVQITVAIRAWTTRGFGPWPNTRKSCGL
jgi:hypothetical protein